MITNIQQIREDMCNQRRGKMIYCLYYYKRLDCPRTCDFAIEQDSLENKLMTKRPLAYQNIESEKKEYLTKKSG